MKGGKTGHVRDTRGHNAVRALKGEEETNSTTISGKNQRTLLNDYTGKMSNSRNKSIDTGFRILAYVKPVALTEIKE